MDAIVEFSIVEFSIEKVGITNTVALFAVCSCTCFVFIGTLFWLTIGVIVSACARLFEGPLLPKHKLIGLSGKFGVGKDTAADWILAEYDVYKVVPFADALKRVVAIMTCTSYESQFTREGKAYVPTGFKHSVGRYQQILGELGRMYFRADLWINIAMSDPAEYKIISDVRYPNEVDAIRAAGGIVLRITRDGVVLNDGRDSTHSSETALDNYKFTHVITNDGTLEEFKEKIMWMLN